MVLTAPKAFILNSLLDSKLSDSLFTINPFIINVISINVKKCQKIPKILLHRKVRIDELTYLITHGFGGFPVVV